MRWYLLGGFGVSFFGLGLYDGFKRASLWFDGAYAGMYNDHNVNVAAITFILLAILCFVSSIAFLIKTATLKPEIKIVEAQTKHVQTYRPVQPELVEQPQPQQTGLEVDFSDEQPSEDDLPRYWKSGAVDEEELPPHEVEVSGYNRGKDGRFSSKTSAGWVSPYGKKLKRDFQKN